MTLAISPNGGNWTISDGSGIGEDNRSDDFSFDGAGTYAYTHNGAMVSGTSSEGGSTHHEWDGNTNATWIANSVSVR